jgi:sterol desaturase/sphingolipid hydroxylase (fatty acid hydroxylase superfamily)
MDYVPAGVARNGAVYQVGCNYGTIFNYWDRLTATNHPASRATFDATRERPDSRTAVGA